MKKFITFMKFSLEFKFPKLVKRKTDSELFELYYKFSPLYWNSNTSLKERIMGGIVIFTVGEEFKRRYPNKHNLQSWDYTEEINLHDVITGGK